MTGLNIKEMECYNVGAFHVEIDMVNDTSDLTDIKWYKWSHWYQMIQTISCHIILNDTKR